MIATSPRTILIKKRKSRPNCIIYIIRQKFEKYNFGTKNYNINKYNFHFFISESVVIVVVVGGLIVVIRRRIFGIWSFHQLLLVVVVVVDIAVFVIIVVVGFSFDALVARKFSSQMTAFVGVGVMTCASRASHPSKTDKMQTSLTTGLMHKE